MRIRSIRPEFWRSEDIKKHPRDVRLLFVGLWSYVDDNGVGVDDYRQIAADLFPLDDDPVEVREYVRDGLARLSRGLQITRYEVAGKRYLLVTNFDNHQKVDRPGKSRYPRPEDLPTSGDDGPKFGHPDDSRDTRDSLDAGEGEKGRRGEGENTLPDSGADVLQLHVPSPPRYSEQFEKAWAAYGRKGAKKTSYAEWQRVAKRADLHVVCAAIPAYVSATPELKYRKDFERWLKGDCWESVVVETRRSANGHTAYQDPTDIAGYYEDF